MLSPGWSVSGTLDQLSLSSQNPAGVMESSHSEQSNRHFHEVPLIVLNLVRLEERQKFCLERELPMVSFLCGNINDAPFAI